VNSSKRISRLAHTLMTHTRRKSPQLAPGIIRFDQGDPYYNTPLPIREALMTALDDGVVHYADAEGDPPLRSSVAAHLTGRTGKDVSPHQVVITHGATGGLAAAILGVVDADDGVIIPEPSYSLYADLVLFAGGRPLHPPCPPPHFRLDLAAIERLAPHARVLVLCNPCNPTGAVFSRTELEEIARIAQRHDLVVIADEAYDHIVYDPTSFTSTLSVPALADRLIYVQTFSKTYAMTGWRIGYVAAPSDLAAACGRIHRTLVGPVNSAVQRAAAVALQHGDEWHQQMLADYRERRDLVVAALEQASETPDVPPAGTFYILAGHPRAVTSEQMVEIAARHGVAVRAGSEYGASGEGYVRVSYSLDRSEVIEGMSRLLRAFDEVSGLHYPPTR
jgi:aspartate aminotransferase